MLVVASVASLLHLLHLAQQEVTSSLYIFLAARVLILLYMLLSVVASVASLLHLLHLLRLLRLCICCICCVFIQCFPGFASLQARSPASRSFLGGPVWSSR